jgi:hypothetical protein
VLLLCGCCYCACSPSLLFTSYTASLAVPEAYIFLQWEEISKTKHVGGTSFYMTDDLLPCLLAASSFLIAALVITLYSPSSLLAGGVPATCRKRGSLTSDF